MKKAIVHTWSDKCGITTFGAIRVGFLKRHHFSLLLIQKKYWQEKALNSNKYFRQDRFYLFCALRMQKYQFSKSEWIFFTWAFQFSLIAKFRALLTSDDVISVLICISSVKVYFEVWFVVLWFTVHKIMTIFLSPTPKLSSCLSSERRTLWRHFWSYCRVTKSLASLFCYATWFSSCMWRETSRTFFAHEDPLSHWTIAANWT